MIVKRIGIVILNYRTWEKTISCVQSINDTYSGEKIIVLVDNQSPNESFEKLSEVYGTDNYKDVVVVQTDHNGGFSYGNNFGFKYIYSKYPDVDKIVITNNDIIFKENAIEALIHGFTYSDKVVLTSPTIYDKGNKTNIPWKKKPNILQELYLISCTPCFYNWEELNKETPSYMVSGCCFVVDRNLFKEIGCLDDNVFLYNEENILSKKIADRMFEIVFCPDAKIIHDHGSTTGNASIFVDTEYVKSSLYFFARYENMSKFNLLLIKYFYIIRIVLKYLLNKYSNKNDFRNALIEIMKISFDILGAKPTV